MFYFVKRQHPPVRWRVPGCGREWLRFAEVSIKVTPTAGAAE
jgi:hypothetical protein